jgi:hypothetical protein
MRKVHISFGDNKYKKSLELLEKTSLENGTEEFTAYSKDWLFSTEFYTNSKRNQYILNQPRGAGYWIWKPYIILETFKTLEDSDIVLYSDAGLKVIDNLNPLYELAQTDPNGGKILFKLPAVGVLHHKAKTWTKKDAFVLMGCDEEKYWNANMGNGAVSLWKKTNENIDFLNEWLEYLRDPRISTDSYNETGKNDPSFRDHRHDQSVLTILATKHNLELFRDPTQYGNEELDLFPNCPYPQLFHHHRNFTH